MSDRKAELDRKKARLAAIREEKLRKEQEKQTVVTTPTTNGGGPDVLRADAEELLKTLGISPTSDPALSPALGSVAVTPGEGSPKLLSSPKSRARKLQYAKMCQTTIAPKEMVAYCKETQTQIAENAGRDMLAYDDAGREDDADARAALEELQKMPHVGLQKQEEKKEEEPLKIREMGDDEKEQILQSDNFVKFFDRSTRLVERAVCEPFDIFTDYSGADREDNDDELSKQALKLNRDFFDERWSRHRVITALDWSPIFPELVLAAYNSNEESPHEPDGVCLVWNMKYKRTAPEYIFHCQSPVTSATFARFHPNIIIGGTYSGQIVLWDNRTNKRTPVQRTLLSTSAHTHPVYSVTVAGTQNAHNLISISSDGKMCAWSLDMLTQPQESRDLQYRQAKSVAASCFAFFANDVNNYVVGSEEGAVYSGCRHGQKAGLGDAFEGHQGPITGIATHTTPGAIDFSHLFLTSSFDWTVRLWSARGDSKPLYSFEDNSDYVYDVEWSPIHPAMFAAVDGAGKLDVWDLNSDAEVPTARAVMDNQAALNKVRWHSSGLHIATGDDVGRVRLFDLNEQMAVPRTDEWSTFSHTIAELCSQTADQHEDAETAAPLR